MNKSKQTGIILGLIGAILVYWAQTHSPKGGIGQIVANELSGSYTLDESSYYLLLVGGIALAVFGIFRFVKG